MLVENDNNLREIYGERLMAEGYDIVSAGDGEEALALAVKEKPDLIVSDVMMPKISGFDMLDILRQTPETKNTKVIMMTALSQTEDKDRADKLGADKYLVKSQVTLEDVARVVHDLIYGEDAEAAQVAEAAATPTVEPVAVATEPTVAPVVVAPEPVVTAPAEPVVATPTEPAVAPVVPTVVAPEPVVAAPVTDDGTAAPTADNPVVPTDVDDDNEGTPIVMPPAPASPVAPEPVVTAPAEPAVATPEPVITSPEATEPIVVAANPMLGTVEPATSSAEAEAPASESAAAQSTQDETNAIAEQINQFVAEQPAQEATHEAPLVEPSAQDLIHAQNDIEDPSVIKPAAPVDPSIPSVTAAPADSPEPASARKKVISPISDPNQGPNIYELYEKEMADEAASTPVVNPSAGASVEAAEPDNNPMTVASTEVAAPLEQIDVSQIEGVTVGEEQPLVAAPTQPEAPVAPEPATTEEKTADPNDPANFAL